METTNNFPKVFEDGETRLRTLADCRERINQSIDEVYREYAAQFPLSTFTITGVAYDRYQRGTEESAVYRLRVVLQHAGRLMIHVPRNMIFVDVTSRRLVEQNLMYAAILSRAASALLVFSETRLARGEIWLTEKLRHIRRETGVRCIFIDSKIDTDG